MDDHRHSQLRSHGYILPSSQNMDTRVAYPPVSTHWKL